MRPVPAPREYVDIGEPLAENKRSIFPIVLVGTLSTLAILVVVIWVAVAVKRSSNNIADTGTNPVEAGQVEEALGQVRDPNDPFGREPTYYQSLRTRAERQQHLKAMMAQWLSSGHTMEFWLRHHRTTASDIEIRDLENYFKANSPTTVMTAPKK